MFHCLPLARPLAVAATHLWQPTVALAHFVIGTRNSRAAQRQPWRCLQPRNGPNRARASAKTALRTHRPLATTNGRDWTDQDDDAFPQSASSSAAPMMRRTLWFRQKSLLAASCMTFNYPSPLRLRLAFISIHLPAEI